ncbi:casein kinase i [Vairimorpha apis BRL 01]|uniref:non-specific serine/threonine protein kinase n=1 Tax=Vairimorpha apis BRL 01 TaxID=1037528 RepID=T0MHV9_9MICR|nr:casein kinase i [Vairimorpha apis BRL 01]
MSSELKNIKLIKKIAGGAFGEIYLAQDTNLRIPVAVKVEKKTNQNQIKHEFIVYTRIKSQNLPKIYAFGKVLVDNIYLSCFVMELLGKSLETLFTECNRKFSIKTVCLLAIKMIENIELLHNKHFLHRDIKPDNFVFNIAQDTVYLIDFGLAKEYRNSVTLKHKEIKYNKSLTGTARYASINTHQGIEQSRRDDLESIGYCLIYFLKGKLPWQGLRAENKLEKYDKIRKVKESTKIWELCSDLPHEFYMYIFYVRNLGYDDWPNYDYLKDLFKELIKKNGWREDSVYDWNQI